METVNDRLKEIKNLADSNLITTEEYYKLRGDILGQSTNLLKEIYDPQTFHSQHRRNPMGGVPRSFLRCTFKGARAVFGIIFRPPS